MSVATKKVLGKMDLVEFIADSAKLSKADVQHSLNAVLEGITSALANGNDVNITGFGKFKVTHKPKYIGRSPSTGAALTILARNKVSFSAGAGLKKSINR